jgi:hypothetical protein
LIQTSVAFVLFPIIPFSSVIDTLKVPAFGFTSFAAFPYLKKMEMN